MKDVTASIVVYKNNLNVLGNTIFSCLDSLPGLHLFVIDNSPEDQARSLCADERITYIFNGQNLGFGKAHNIALKKALEDSRYHIVVNPDVYFDKAVIPELYDFMEVNTDAGMVMPKVLYPDGSLQYLCKLLPTPYYLIGRRFLKFYKNFEKSNHHYEMRFTGYDHIMDVPFISGCFMFLRTEALKKSGLFDERIFLYTEDMDLSRRVHKYYRTVFYPHATIYHIHARKSYRKTQFLWYHINSAISYFNKWGWFKDVERDEINKKILLNYLVNDQA